VEPSVHPEPLEPVRRPVMYQSWNWISFLHWRYDARTVQALVPPRLEVEAFDGSAWVSVTPFLMENLRVAGTPALPWFSTTPETNVRTYVRGPDGRPGIWFFSLDIARLPAVAGGRLAYFLPYVWSRMRFRRQGNVVQYAGVRRWSAPRAGYDIAVEMGDPIPMDVVSDLDHFLTGRWVLFTFYGRRAASASVEHPRWPLRRASVVRLREDLLSAARLPPPTGEPLVHASNGVDTRIGPPRLLSPLIGR
jgi:uncharacterized protein